MLTRDDLKGPWAGLPVAWDENLGFDEKAYRTDLERACKTGVPGVYTAGTTGEFYAMEGLTPFTRMGSLPIWLLAGLFLLPGFVRRR